MESNHKKRHEQRLQVMGERKTAFLATFDGPMAERVLDFLSGFCREHESCYREDAREHALLEGRREVILTIRRYLELEPEKLVAYYHRKST